MLMNKMNIWKRLRAAVETTNASQTDYVVVTAPARAWTVKLTSRKLTIGRSRNSEIRLDSPVTPTHAILKQEFFGYTIMDLGKMPGTRLNRRRLSPHFAAPLCHLDIIEIGDVKLLYESPSQSILLSAQSRGNLDKRVAAVLDMHPDSFLIDLSYCSEDAQVATIGVGHKRFMVRFAIGEPSFALAPNEDDDFDGEFTFPESNPELRDEIRELANSLENETEVRSDPWYRYLSL